MSRLKLLELYLYTQVHYAYSPQDPQHLQDWSPLAAIPSLSVKVGKYMDCKLWPSLLALPNLRSFEGKPWRWGAGDVNVTDAHMALGDTCTCDACCSRRWDEAEARGAHA